MEYANWKGDKQWKHVFQKDLEPAKNATETEQAIPIMPDGIIKIIAHKPKAPHVAFLWVSASRYRPEVGNNNNTVVHRRSGAVMARALQLQGVKGRSKRSERRPEGDLYSRRMAGDIGVAASEGAEQDDRGKSLRCESEGRIGVHDKEGHDGRKFRVHPPFGTQRRLPIPSVSIHSTSDRSPSIAFPVGPDGDPEHRSTHIGSLLRKGTGEDPDGNVSKAIARRETHFSFGNARALSGSARGRECEVTGFIQSRTSTQPVPTKQLIEAFEALERVLQRVNLEEANPNGAVAGDVALIPGGSSGTAAACVKDENGEWIRLDSTHVSSAPLDEISGHALDSKKLLREAWREDQGLAKMVRVFLFGETATAPKPPIKLSSKVSRGFLDSDVKMLRKAGIIKARRCKNALPGFKVPKRDPKKSRFITDCREFNKCYVHFKEEKMEIPRLHLIMEAGCRFKYSASIDASAYFFQFKLGGEVQEDWFPLRLRVRGKIKHVVLTRLPMGFHLAPIIAQRTSNLIVKKTRVLATKEGVCGAVFAWVDNFIVFADSESDRGRIMSILENQLRAFNIKCSEVDTSQSFLGLTRVEGGLRLEDSFVTRFRASIRDALTSNICGKKQLEILSGMIMWLNYTTVRIPLAARPATLEMIRHIATMPDATQLRLSGAFRKELVSWHNEADRIYTLPISQTLTTVWSDARPYRICIIIDSLVLIGRSKKPIDIIVAEAIAAAWGIIMSNHAAASHIDNKGPKQYLLDCVGAVGGELCLGGASRGVLRTSPARAEAASSRKGLSDNDLPAGVGVCADFLPGGGDKCRPSSLVSDAPLRWPLAGLMGPVGLGCAKLFPATQAKVANTPTQNCKDPAANKVEKRHTGVYSVGNVHVLELRLLFRPTASGKPFVNQLAVFMPVVGLRFPLLCPGWLIFLSFCATRPRRFARVLFVLFFCLRQ